MFAKCECKCKNCWDDHIVLSRLLEERFIIPEQVNDDFKVVKTMITQLNRNLEDYKNVYKTQIFKVNTKLEELQDVDIFPANLFLVSICLLVVNMLMCWLLWMVWWEFRNFRFYQ